MCQFNPHGCFHSDENQADRIQKMDGPTQFKNSSSPASDFLLIEWKERKGASYAYWVNSLATRDELAPPPLSIAPLGSLSLGAPAHRTTKNQTRREGWKRPTPTRDLPLPDRSRRRGFKLSRSVSQ